MRRFPKLRSRRAVPKPSRSLPRAWRVEALEERALLAITLDGETLWAEAGPAPIHGNVNSLIPPDSPVSGAVNAILPDPNDPDILYIATVNGGVWRSVNANWLTDGIDNNANTVMDAADPTERPEWTALMDQFPSLAMSSLASDPDSADQIYAGIGRRRSSAYRGGSQVGLYTSANAGISWSHIRTDRFDDLAVRSIVPLKGNKIFVATARSPGVLGQVPGLLVSNDPNLLMWDSLSNTPGALNPDPNKLPAGDVTSFVADPSNDPNNPMVFYAGVAGSGVYRTTDGGATWKQIFGPANATAADHVSKSRRVQLAISPVGPNHTLSVVLIAPKDFAQSNLGDPPSRVYGVFQSNNPRAAMPNMVTWEQLPAGDVAGNSNSTNLNPSSQATIHFSMAADPVHPRVIYLGGDTQPHGFSFGPFGNSSGCNGYMARIFRGDGAASSDHWKEIVCNGANGTSPHADSRAMAFDANGNLLEGDDGGLYKLLNPGTPGQKWVSLTGNLNATEFVSVAYDSVNNTIIGGAQDNGVSEQQIGTTAWRSVACCDGAQVAVRNVYSIADNPVESYHFSSYQELGDYKVRKLNSTNTVVDDTSPDLDVSWLPIFDSIHVWDSPPFFTPFVLNTVDPTRMLIGTQTL